MKISEIQPGKKYTQTKHSHKRERSGIQRLRAKVDTTVRVLQVDPAKGIVLASINEAPAIWVDGKTTRYWKPFVSSANTTHGANVSI